MITSRDRILTTHSGSLSRPADLIALNRARAQGEKVDDATYAKCLGAAVADVVRKIDLNEYKRKQAAPGLKITPLAFGVGRRIPIVQKYVS